VSVSYEVKKRASSVPEASPQTSNPDFSWIASVSCIPPEINSSATGSLASLEFYDATKIPVPMDAIKWFFYVNPTRTLPSLGEGNLDRSRIFASSIGPNEHATGPNEHATGPNEHATGPNEHATGPNEHATGPNEHATGPNEHATGPNEHANERARLPLLPQDWGRYRGG